MFIEVLKNLFHGETLLTTEKFFLSHILRCKDMLI